MRLLFLSQLFDPENSIKGLEFARQLTKQGHSVEVITAFPSYPGGRIYAGYKSSLVQTETIDGVRVVRLGTYITHDKSAVKRLLGYASFGVNAFLYVVFSRRKCDVIYAYYPPVVVGLLAWGLSLVKKVPFIYDIQDLWPDALVGAGIVHENGRVVKFLNKACDWVYRKAAAIVVLSEGYKKSLIERGVPFEKVKIIFNWCDESRLHSEFFKNQEYSTTKTFSILYAGNLGAAQALEFVLDAAEILKNRGCTRILFIFVGSGVESEKLKALASQKKLTNVLFKPAVPVDQVGDILAGADALLVHLASSPVFDITIPSKTQAYMSIGKPILMAVNGDAAEIIENAQCGVVAESCNAEEIAKAAIELSRLSPCDLQKMSENAKVFYSNNMSMSQGVDQVSRLLEEVRSHD